MQESYQPTIIVKCINPPPPPTKKMEWNPNADVANKFEILLAKFYRIRPLQQAVATNKQANFSHPPPLAPQKSSLEYIIRMERQKTKKYVFRQAKGKSKTFFFSPSSMLYIRDYCQLKWKSLVLNERICFRDTIYV